MLELGRGEVALHALWADGDLLVSVVSASEQALLHVEECAAEGGYVSRLTTRRAPLVPVPEAAGAFDRVLWRGDLSSMPPGLLAEVVRVLRPGGAAWLGGGEADSLQDACRLLSQESLAGVARVVADEGLWIEVRRPPETTFGEDETGGRP